MITTAVSCLVPSGLNMAAPDPVHPWLPSRCFHLNCVLTGQKMCCCEDGNRDRFPKPATVRSLSRSFLTQSCTAFRCARRLSQSMNN